MNGSKPKNLDDALAHTHTGEEYFKYITSLESDRRARAAFQDLVLKTAPPGGALFDFGAGPGIDARFFAERGFTVEAYDVDPRMREFFAEYCRDLLEAGRVALQCGSYADFLAREVAPAARHADLVISNFAPLNLVDDLAVVFAKFHALTAPNGRVLASVLNPFHWADMKYRWWWRKLPEIRRKGHYFMPGPQAPHMRRNLADFAARSLPYFRLTRVFRGLPISAGRLSNGIGVSGGGGAWLHLGSARFMFLLFEKNHIETNQGRVADHHRVGNLCDESGNLP
jgi:SAM-dependent methyltransferase